MDGRRSAALAIFAFAAGTTIAFGQPATPEPIPVPVVPRFELIHLDWSLGAAIAGTAEAGAFVEVLADGVPVAAARANAIGEWALLLDRPLGAGAHDLAIRTTSADGGLQLLSDQRVAVSVPLAGSDEFVAALSEPGAPTRILQLPQPMPPLFSPPGATLPGVPAPPIAAAPANPPVLPPSPGEPIGDVAALEIGGAPAPSPEARPGPQGVGATPGGGGAPMAGMLPAPGAEATQIAPEAQLGIAPPAEPAPSALGLPILGEPVQAPVLPPVAQITRPEALPAEQPVAPAPITISPAPAAAPPLPPLPPIAVAPRSEPLTAAPPPAIGGAPPDEAPSASAIGGPLILPAVAIETVETDGDGALFVTGTALTDDPVRIYLDDAFLGEVAPTAGRWEFRGGLDLAPSPHAVRADQVDIAAAEVMARAEVTFVPSEQPLPEPQPQPARPPQAAQAPAAPPREQPAPEPPPPAPQLIPPPQEVPPPAELPAPAPQAPVPPPASAAQDAQAPAPPPNDQPVAQPQGQPLPAQPPSPQQAAPVPEPPPEQRTVTIVRGDNLWTIARHTYGRGIRYVVIYEANRDQIRDPDLIYPGQVFVLPPPDPAWQAR